ncbi:TPA: ATP-binding protein [Stenotrophomonas maltophilia]
MSTAEAFPAKRFFVDMLVRDIELKDAILDLLDNCVDGVMRSPTQPEDPAIPYAGYWARIEFNENSFTIKDNCGGIPFEIAEESAFRLGRKNAELDAELPTVGLYGIGMKRAIFKMGTSARIKSERSDKSFYVDITPEWMLDDDTWTFDMVEISNPEELSFGTTIRVGNLRPAISNSFSRDEFLNEFREAVRAYYGYIIEKGFKVFINDVEADSRKIKLILEDNPDDSGQSIAPYIYRREGQPDGVDVHLSVGLYRNSLSDEEEEQELEGRASSESAGWTIICNDRVVLHADKSRLTGWGESGVPSYHTQFVAIAGTVVFRSNDPSKLPLTTTKRGVDASSEIYLQVKDFMRDGLKLFTNYTNKWKKRPTERKERESQTESVSLLLPEEIVKNGSLKFTTVRKTIGGEQFRPALPAPESFTDQWIRFSRPKSEIEALSDLYFGTTDAKPSEVGEECFSRAVRELSK